MNLNRSKNKSFSSFTLNLLSFLKINLNKWFSAEFGRLLLSLPLPLPV